MSAANIKVEAMIAYYGVDTFQKEKVICRGDSAALPLAGKRFFIYTAANVKHGFYFYTGSDPAPVVPGVTMHGIVFTALDSALVIAGLVQAAIDGISASFDATVSGNVVTFTHVLKGYASSAEDGVLTFATQFGLTIEEQGDTEDALGCVDGDIELKFAESFVDVKCHDTGTTPIAQLKTGVSNVEATLNLLETTEAQMKKLFTKTNGSFTPNGGTEVYGMGTYKNFENMFKFAKPLRLHPARLLAGDRSGDFTFHKAIPNLEGLTFSGEAVFKIPAKFKVFPAEGINARVNYFSIGDSTQNLG